MVACPRGANGGTSVAIGFETVGIVGGGLVGSGWSVIFALAGLEVRVFDGNPEIRRTVQDFATRTMTEMAELGLASNVQDALDRIVVCETLESAVSAADYIQESVFERQDVKADVSLQIGTAMRPDAIVGSSSSGIPASAFTQSVLHRERFLIVHPVNPPHLVPVVEIVPAPWTEPGLVDAVRALMERIGQVPVVVTREIEGFVLNRLQGALLQEAFALLEEGYASTADIDATISHGLGLRWAFMGPFETIDLNAPGGISDYAARFGGLYRSIANSRNNPREWSDELVSKATAERRSRLPQSELAARRQWRDQTLMRLVAHLRHSRDGKV
jgi:L-gulonate 3-dehydrogenase